MWWHYWYGIGLVIHRMRVRVQGEHHHIVTLGTSVPLSSNSIIWYQPRGDDLWLGK